MPAGKSIFAGGLGLLLLTGCAAGSWHSMSRAALSADVCVLPQEHRMLVAELFFGRAVKGRAPISETEWAAFAAQTITPAFPDGFTVFNGDGQWRNPRTGQIARDPTKILLVAAPRTPDLARRLATVIAAYKTRFDQQSVGVVTRDACGSFD
ncbi:MAG TPA: DUF3574 domain-containing protein [Stellaceae bacterium]|nr:DUF3574 domain-containing protein [Stellaceae bacterium]